MAELENNKIHSAAIINKGAKIGDNVSIGPFSIVGSEVIIDDGVNIGPNVVIEGRTTIHKNARIFQFASIGACPQDLKYAGEDTSTEIGENTVIREFVTIHKGTAQGTGITKIGKNCLVMAYCHVAHDCLLGNNVIMANGATMGGHVEIGNYVVIGGLSAIHQFCHIGDYAFIGGMSGINKDIPPFVKYWGIKGKIYGLNLVGLKRNGFTREQLDNIKDVYRKVFKGDEPLTQVTKRLLDGENLSLEAGMFLNFIANAKRGVPTCRDESELNGD